MTIKKTAGVPFDIDQVAHFILHCQQTDGAIRWFPQGKLDPWDHTEAAMALTIAGKTDNARRAYQWLHEQQNIDGSWQAQHFVCDDPSKVETHFVAYPATGIWHYYSITRDTEFLRTYFPMVERAIEYVLREQHPEGDIQWAQSSQESLARDALVTGCSSILRSLEYGLHIAAALRIEKPHWRAGYAQLAAALRNKPWRFDRTWESKARFSMDWFYPILAGIYSIDEARLRLSQRWHEFVEESLGCRCVNDEPWVTVAESCELVIATLASGQRQRALDIFKWLGQWQDGDGGYWTGYNFRDKVIWPREKTSWTAAAILLAADALYELTPAARLFIQPSQFAASDCKTTND